MKRKQQSSRIASRCCGPHLVRRKVATSGCSLVGVLPAVEIGRVEPACEKPVETAKAGIDALLVWGNANGVFLVDFVLAFELVVAMGVFLPAAIKGLAFLTFRHLPRLDNQRLLRRNNIRVCVSRRAYSPRIGAVKRKRRTDTQSKQDFPRHCTAPSQLTAGFRRHLNHPCES